MSDPESAAGPRPTKHFGRAGTISNRRFERVAVVDATVEIYLEDTLIAKLLFRKPSNLGIGVVDVSESGLRVEVVQQLTAGTRVRTVVRIKAFNETLEGMARVVWCAPTRTPGRFLAGLDFFSVQDGHYGKIQHLRRAMLSPEMKQKLATRRREEQEAAKGGSEEGDEGLVIMPPPSS